MKIGLSVLGLLLVSFLIGQTEFILFVTIFDAIGAVLIFVGLAGSSMIGFPVWDRFIISVGAVGLLGQVWRNVIYLSTGVSPSDIDMPLWVLKDASLAGISVTMLLTIIGKKWQ